MSPLSDQDKAVIFALALGQRSVLARALAIHRAYLRTHGVQRGDPYFDFMSEIDNPCPDLLLRARFRKAVIKEWNNHVEKTRNA